MTRCEIYKLAWLSVTNLVVCYIFRTLAEKVRDTLSLTPTKSSKRLSGGESIESIEDRLKSTQEALASAISSIEMEACLRSRKETEADAIMDELVDTKIRYAHVASELDVERVRTMKLRDKLELYAERLTMIEVRHSQRM